MTIELTPWILALIVVGGVVVAFLSAIGLAALYSYITGNPVNVKLGPLTVQIDDEQ